MHLSLRVKQTVISALRENSKKRCAQKARALQFRATLKYNLKVKAYTALLFYRLEKNRQKELRARGSGLLAAKTFAKWRESMLLSQLQSQMDKQLGHRLLRKCFLAAVQVLLKERSARRSANCIAKKVARRHKQKHLQLWGRALRDARNQN